MPDVNTVSYPDMCSSESGLLVVTGRVWMESTSPTRLLQKPSPHSHHTDVSPLFWRFDCSLINALVHFLTHSADLNVTKTLVAEKWATVTCLTLKLIISYISHINKQQKFIPTPKFTETSSSISNAPFLNDSRWSQQLKGTVQTYLLLLEQPRSLLVSATSLSLHHDRDQQPVIDGIITSYTNGNKL